MANTAGVSRNFVHECMSGIHALGTTVVRAGTTADTVKAALYLATATINSATTIYTVSGECTVTGGYVAGGVTVTNATAPSLDTETGIWQPSTSIVFSNISPASAVNCILIYNSTQTNKSIEVCTFAGQAPVAADLTLTMPPRDRLTALLRIASV